MTKPKTPPKQLATDRIIERSWDIREAVAARLAAYCARTRVRPSVAVEVLLGLGLDAIERVPVDPVIDRQAVTYHGLRLDAELLAKRSRIRLR